MSKLTLVIIDFLFHSYSTSHFRLMFYVLCKYIQPDHYRFIPFYALRNFFPSPPLSNYLPRYAEDVAWHMASLPSPKSSRSERSYDHGVFNLIDNEATWCLEKCFLCNLCCIWNFLLGSNSCYLAFSCELCSSFTIIQ
jgi:hypothetical protein